MKQNSLRNEWPEPPRSENGAPRSWIVATKAFNGASKINLRVQAQGWSLDAPARNDDDRACYLVGYYDADYRSFHVQRCFEDGARENIFDLGRQTNPPDYKAILNLMQAWQAIAQLNATSERRQGREIESLKTMTGFDPILYKKAP